MSEMNMVQDEVRVIYFPVGQVDASPFQARRRFDERGLGELAESLKQHGVLQPLIGREVVPGRIELIAGERRLRAARLAGLGYVPVLLRELTDTEAEEVMLIENLQREDLSPSEEAEGYQRMLALQSDAGQRLYTQESLALRLGKSPNHVRDRLKLLRCPPALMEAVNVGEVALSVAMLVGRIPDAKEREKAGKMVLRPELQQVPLNYEQTREMIRETFMVSLKGCGFDPEDARLIPVVKDEAGVRVMGGACGDCPFRSGNGEDVQLSVSMGDSKGMTSGVDANLCTLPACCRKKQEAAWTIVRRQAEEQGLKVLEGDAARRLFGFNGALAEGCGYLDAETRPTFEEIGIASQDNKAKWKTLLHGALPIVIVRHPTSGKRMELVDRRQAVELLKERLAKVAMGNEKEESGKEESGNGDGDGALGTMRPTGAGDGALGTTRPTKRGAMAKLEAAEMQRALEAEAAKEAARVDAGLVKVQMHSLLGAVMAEGLSLEQAARLFALGLKSGGVDGVSFLGGVLGVKLGKGEKSADYEAAVLAYVQERAGTLHGWMGYTLLALMARSLKHAGTRDEDLRWFVESYGVVKTTTEVTENTEGGGEAGKSAHAPLGDGDGALGTMRPTGEVTDAAQRVPTRVLLSVVPLGPESEWLQQMMVGAVPVVRRIEGGEFPRARFMLNTSLGDVFVGLAELPEGSFLAEYWADLTRGEGWCKGGAHMIDFSRPFPSREAAVCYCLCELEDLLTGWEAEDEAAMMQRCLQELEVMEMLVPAEDLQAIEYCWLAVPERVIEAGPVARGEVEQREESDAAQRVPTNDGEAGRSAHSPLGDGALGTTCPTGVDYAGLPFEGQVRALARGECELRDVIGVKPKAGDVEGLRVWSAKRMQLKRAVKKESENLAAEIG